MFIKKSVKSKKKKKNSWPNTYRKSINLHECQSIKSYANKFKVDGDNYDLFPETKDEKEVYYYACEWKLKCYKGKDGDLQYTRK